MRLLVTMRRRRTTWLAGSLWATWFALVAMLVLIGSGTSRPLLAVVATFGMVTVGALVASRQPANPIGWVFCGLGLGFMVGGVSSEYATRALVDAPGSLPAGVAVAWLASWVQFPVNMLVLYLLLLFPNGHPPSPRWRGVVWLVTALIAVGTLSVALRSGPLRTGPTGMVLPVDNPLAVEAIAPLLEGIIAVWPVALVALLLTAIGSVILRFRRARGDERQQLKWFAFATGFVPVVIASTIALRPLPEEVRAPIQTAIFGTAMLLFPVVVGIAVLRYRLYDINFLINRTLVYGVVTAVLGLIFALLSAGAQRVLESVTGERSDVVTVGAALAIALTFAPLRARVQAFVDRFQPDRRMLTLLFTDIVDSTGRAIDLGDLRWRQLLERYYQTVRREIGRAEGREIDTTGDGFLVSFESPGRAIRGAAAIRQAVENLGIAMRIGLHGGECELRGREISGITVHTAARVMAAAGAGEIFVSGTVRDLVAGSGIRFRERGAHALKGIPGEWQLYAVEAV